MKNWVTNTRYTVHTLWLCIYPVICTILGVLVIVSVPQGTEVVFTYLDKRGGMGTIDEGVRHAFLVLACLSWSLCSWYACRLLLGKEFPDEPDAPVTPFAVQWRVWFPRVMAAAGPILVAAFLPKFEGIDAEFGLRVSLAAVGGLAFAFAVLRRSAMRLVTGRAQSTLSSVPEAARQVARLPTSDHLALTLLLSFSIAIAVGVVLGGYGFTRFLGAPTLVFLALAGITLLGSIVFVFFPKAFGGPSLALLPPIVFVLFAQFGWTNNHVLSNRPELAKEPKEWRKDLGADFKEWLARHPEGDIVLVAAEGGASRSAWWTAHVLGALDHQTQGRFSRQVYAISGVSGGSLGAATYVALLAKRGATTISPGAFEQRNDIDCESLDESVPLSVQSACFLGRDFLSPAIGYMLYPDLLQRFWPIARSDWDRSLGLERSWQHDWRGTFGTKTFAMPMESLYSQSDDLPRLLLNATMGSSGKLAIQSSVKLPLDGESGVEDLFKRWPQGMNMSLASIVHNSARFPVVSPGGLMFEAHKGEPRYVDVLMDGGYFENSGAAALMELVRGIQQEYKDPSEWNRIRSRIVVLFITNDPPARDPERDKQGCAVTQPKLQPIRQEELLTPLLGLYSTRTARAAAARLELIRLINTGATTPRASITIPLDSNDLAKFPPSMNWHLAAASRARMWSAIKEPCVTSRIAQLLAPAAPTTPATPGLRAIPPINPKAFVQTRKEDLR